MKTVRLPACAGAAGDTRGATSTEYALLLAFLAVVIVLSVRLFGGVLVDVFSLYPDLTTS